MLYMVAACAAVVGTLLGICKVVGHPVNRANFEYYTNHPKDVDPWSYLNYRNPPY